MSKESRKFRLLPTDASVERLIRLEQGAVGKFVRGKLSREELARTQNRVEEIKKRLKGTHRTGDLNKFGHFLVSRGCNACEAQRHEGRHWQKALQSGVPPEQVIVQETRSGTLYPSLRVNLDSTTHLDDDKLRQLHCNLRNIKGASKFDLIGIGKKK